MSEGDKRAYVEVAAAILWRDGRYLAVERPQGKPMAGFWEFPGGKAEPGETLGQALVRELEEELGVSVREFAFWKEKAHSYERISVRLHFFHVRDFTGTPKPLEGQRMAWVAPAEAPDWPFLEADRDIVRELAKIGAQGAVSGR